jgi:hypothetical protein
LDWKLSLQGKREPPNHPSPPFKEKEKVGEGRSKAWWSMEGEGKGAWLGGQWKEKEKEKVLGLVANGRTRRRFFSTSSTFPPSNLLKPSFFLSFTLRFYFALVLGHYLRPPFVFLGL